MQPGEATNLALYLQSGKYFKPAIWGSAMLVLKNINFENAPVCSGEVCRKATKWGTKIKMLQPGEAMN